MTYHWSERLRSLNVCSNSLKWAVTQESPIAAWRACEDGSWLLWIAATLGVDRRLIVTAACKCARLALPYVPEGEERPIKAIETAERWVDGLVTIDEVRSASYAAADAARAIYADAAYAAAYAAYYACSAVAFAADAALAYAADAYAADAYAPEDAYGNVMRQCADIVRSTISEDVMRELWENLA